MFKSALLAGTLALSLASAAHAKTPALDYHGHPWPIIGTPAYSASCTITRAWEDGSAVAYCTEDGETYAFDADGGFIMDNGIVFYYRAPGSWYVAPELLQVGPNAPAEAR